MSSELSKFWDLVPSLTSTGLPLGAKDKLYSGYVCSVILNGSKTWPVTEGDAIRLEKNDARMVRWIYNISPEARISAEELGASLKLLSMRECL